MNRLVLYFMLLPLFGRAQNELLSLSGKWQEEIRTTKKNQSLQWKDSLRLEIRSDGFMMVRHDMGATLTGEAECNGATLHLGKISFTIEEIKPDQLILSDGDGKHQFKRIPEFSNAPVKRLVPGIEQGKREINFAILKGKWTCYKKTDPDFNRAKFYLKSIDFTQDTKPQEWAATAAFNNNDSVYSKNVVVQIKGHNLIIQCQDQSLMLDILKSDGEELILQAGNIYYFLKQFSKNN